MKTRDEVQSMLEEVLESKNVYFQAPPNTGMQYPCIVYNFITFDMEHADNIPYIVTGHYEIQHMYKSIKNDLKEKMIYLCPYLRHDRRIKTNGVYNDYYILNQ